MADEDVTGWGGSEEKGLVEVLAEFEVLGLVRVVEKYVGELGGGRGRFEIGEDEGFGGFKVEDVGELFGEGEVVFLEGVDLYIEDVEGGGVEEEEVLGVEGGDSLGFGGGGGEFALVGWGLEEGVVGEVGVVFEDEEERSAGEGEDLEDSGFGGERGGEVFEE